MIREGNKGTGRERSNSSSKGTGENMSSRGSSETGQTLTDMMVEDKMTETKSDDESIAIGRIVIVMMILEDLTATMCISEWTDMTKTTMSADNSTTEGMLIAMMVKEGTGTTEGICSSAAIETGLSVPIITIESRIETFEIRMSSEKMRIKVEGNGIEMSHEGERIETMIQAEIDETVRAITSETTSRLDESSAPKIRLKLGGLPTPDGSMSWAMMFSRDREMRPATRTLWRT